MELRWPLCTGLTLGWCRMLSMAVSIPSYGYCPVVVDRCLMLNHTQCNRSPAWTEQWPGTVSEVSQSPHFKWATTRMRLRASLHCVFSTMMCFLNEMCESHHSRRNFVDPSTGRSVFPTLTVRGLWVRHRVAVKCMTLHSWAANLKPYLVAHSCMSFTACCKCLSMVFRERPWKQIAMSSTKCALKMSLAIQVGCSLIFNLKHVTARTPPIETPSSGFNSSECCPNSDSDSAFPEIFWHKNRPSASEANPVKVSDDTILPGCLISFFQFKEKTSRLLPFGKSIPEISFKTHWVVGGITMLLEATLAFV